MIDKARIDELFVEVQRNSIYGIIGMEECEAFALLTEHLALRSIAEALAAENPPVYLIDGYWKCACCGERAIFGSGVGFDFIPHGERCPHARAVALVGAPNGPDGGGAE